jgi:hypothetical protein
MQYFYDLAAGEGGVDIASDEAAQGYEATAAFLEARGRVAAAEARFHARAEQIAGMRPAVGA